MAIEKGKDNFLDPLAFSFLKIREILGQRAALLIQDDLYRDRHTSSISP
jgi:hypothetical protein